jgi:hypothetical protein
MEDYVRLDLVTIHERTQKEMEGLKRGILEADLMGGRVEMIDQLTVLEARLSTVERLMALHASNQVMKNKG